MFLYKHVQLLLLHSPFARLTMKGQGNKVGRFFIVTGILIMICGNVQCLPAFILGNTSQAPPQAKILYSATGTAAQTAATMLAESENIVRLDSVIPVYDAQEVWIQIMLFNPAPLRTTRIIQFVYTNIQVIQAFDVDDACRLIGESGASIPMDQRNPTSNKPSFAIQVEGGSKANILFKIRNHGPFLSQLFIHTPEAMVKNNTLQDVMMGLALGGLILLCLFNLLLFGAMEDSLFALFVVHCIGLILYIVALSGYGKLLLWPSQPWLTPVFTSVGALMHLLSASIITMQLLSDGKRSPWIRLSLNTLLSCSVFMAAGAAFQNSWLVLIGGYLIIISAILTWVCILSKKQQNRKTMIWAGLYWIFMGLGGALSQPWATGIDPRAFMGDGFEHLDKFLLLLGTLSLSVCLSRRLNQIKYENNAVKADFKAHEMLLASVSHEMRNPLNCIIGMAENIDGSRNDRELLNIRSKILDESNRLLYQINQILDAAKLSYGEVQLAHDPFCPLDCIHYIKSVVEHKIDADKVLFQVSVNMSAHATWFLGDEKRFEQIVRNLCDNAIKFTAHGHIIVRISTMRDETNPRVGDIELEIEDTGIGMDETAQARAFTDFLQGTPTILRQYGGTGLGMGISARLVRAMNGTITLTSAPGKGSIFNIKLSLPLASHQIKTHANPDSGMEIVPPGKADSTTPLLDRPQSPESPPVAVPRLLAGTGKNRSIRVLMADDSATSLEICRMHLNAQEFALVTVASGDQALKLLKNQSFDIFFVDLYMAGLSGIQTALAIRSGASETVNLPIVGLTAAASDQEMAACFAAGMNRVLFKPFHKQDLIDTIRDLLPDTR